VSGIASSSDEQLLAALRKHIKSGGSMRQHRAAARALLREARDAIGRQSAERRREIGQIERQLDAAHGRPAAARRGSGGGRGGGGRGGRANVRGAGRGTGARGTGRASGRGAGRGTARPSPLGLCLGPAPSRAETLRSVRATEASPYHRATASPYHRAAASPYHRAAASPYHRAAVARTASTHAGVHLPSPHPLPPRHPAQAPPLPPHQQHHQQQPPLPPQQPPPQQPSPQQPQSPPAQLLPTTPLPLPPPPEARAVAGAHLDALSKVTLAPPL
jgi:hypothetical protein